MAGQPFHRGSRSIRQLASCSFLGTLFLLLRPNSSSGSAVVGVSEVGVLLAVSFATCWL